MQIINLPMQGLFQGAQPITSYNYGAGKLDRVKKSVRLLTTTAVIYGTLFWLALMLVPQMFVGMFTGDAELTEMTVWAMRIFLAGVFAFGFQGAFQNSFLALGQAKVSLLLALLRKIVLLIPLIFIMPLFFENRLFGVFVAEPIADITAAIVTTVSFLMWARRNLNKPGEEV